MQLYIEILEQFLYFFDRNVDGFTPTAVQPVIDLIKTGLTAGEAETTK